MWGRAETCRGGSKGQFMVFVLMGHIDSNSTRVLYAEVSCIDPWCGWNKETVKFECSVHKLG